MSKFRIVFLGTPDIAVPCLGALLEDDHFELQGVITQPDRPAGRSQKVQASPVKQLAVEKGIEVITPEKISDPEVLMKIKSWRAEAAVVVAYGQILPEEFFATFPKGAVNIHASLLPRWRGAAPIQRALTNGDSETGVALQLMVQKLDAGPIIGIRKFDLDSEINAAELYEKLKNLAPELLKVDYLDYLRGQLTPVPQDESVVTIAKKIKKEEGLINWERPATEIHNLVRGLWMWPGTWTLRDGKVLKIKKTKVVTGLKGRPGTVLRAEPGGFVVACGQHALEIQSVQPESRSVMAASDYLKGYNLKVGDQLGGE